MINIGDPVTTVFSGKLGLVVDKQDQLVVAISSSNALLINEDKAHPVKWNDLEYPDKEALQIISKFYEISINKL